MSGFRYRLRTRYSECDAQGVVFNVRYGEYVELAVTEFFRALGYGAALKSGELDYQLVKQTLEWKSPARFDDVIEVGVAATRVGTTSFTMACAFRVADRPDAIATAETVYVLVDHGTLSKKKIADGLRAQLQRGVGTVINHAGP